MKEQKPDRTAATAQTAPPTAQQIASEPASSPPSPSRRAFLGKATAATLAAGAVVAAPKLLQTSSAEAQTPQPACTITPANECGRGCDIGPLEPLERAKTAFSVRVDAAKFEGNKELPAHPCNNDEWEIPDFGAAYSKGLMHDSLGIVTPTSYRTLLQALSSGKPSAFNDIILGCTGGTCVPGMRSAGTQMGAGEEVARFAAENGASPDEAPVQRRLVDPQAALAFDLSGVDSHQAATRQGPFCPISFAAAPSFSSAEEIAEIAENYWMALARDVHFAKYETDPITIAAASDLSNFTDFKGPKVYGPMQNCFVTPRTLFRGITRSRPINPQNPCDDAAGIDDLKGPYVSQFLLRDIPYGTQCISARQRTVRPGIDYMTDFDVWKTIQDGCKPTESDALDGFRYIRNGRDLGQYVHIDLVFQAFFNAALILLTPPMTSFSTPSDCTGGGLGAPFDEGNPYTCQNSRTQIGFSTFGGQHLMTLLLEAHNRALNAVWYQKWSVHRRLRPEEFAGRIDSCETGRDRRWCEYFEPDNYARLRENVLQIISEKYGSYLLPQAYPEGSPLHPSYGTGHGTVSAACATILKAWFIESTPLLNPVEANGDGTALVPYNGADRTQLTVGGELNKLVSNIAIGRDIAGVHWRSDYTESTLLGEAVAISVLQDYGFTYNENKEGFFVGFKLTKFDGTTITVGQRPV